MTANYIFAIFHETMERNHEKKVKTWAFVAGNVIGTVGSFRFAQFMIHVNFGSRKRSQIERSSNVRRHVADVNTML